MIGNDVISLEIWREQFSRRSQRKIERLFTASERSYIEQADDIFTTTALLWSMKESAYKYFNRLNRIREYAPKHLEATFSPTDKTGSVVSRYGTVQCRSVVRENYIHTMTIHPAAKSMIIKMDTADKSLIQTTARPVLQKNISSELGCLPGHIRIYKEIGLPCYTIRGQFPRPMSLSHDGNYYACCYIAEN